MTFEIGAAITLLLAIIGAVFGYGQMANKVEAIKEVHVEDKKEWVSEKANLWLVIQQIRDWQQRHTEESHNYRMEFIQKLNEGDTSAKVNGTRFNDIIRRLELIENLFKEKNRPT